jgi:hypothetical protein
LKRNIIAFTGPAGSGKTTAADQTSGHRLSFGTPIKVCLAELLKFTPWQLYTFEGKTTIDERYGVTPRDAMQQFGTEFARKLIPGLCCILMKQEILSLPDNFYIVIDDCRFEDEAQLVRDLGGTVVHILDRRPVSGDTHQSERGVEIVGDDLAIRNNGPLENFLREVDLVEESLW